MEEEFMKNVNEMSDIEILKDLKAPKVTLEADGTLTFPEYLSDEQKQLITESWKNICDGNGEEITEREII